MEKGDNATTVSYAEAFKNLKPSANDNGISLIKKFPDPAPIDEVYLKRKDLTRPEEKPKTAVQEDKISVERVLLTIGIIVGALLLFLMLLPSLIYGYYVMRYRNAKPSGKSYWVYRAATFYLHQVGIYRGDQTPMQYARATVDPEFGTSFASFINIYLKQKYARQSLTGSEEQAVAGFLAPFIGMLRKKIGFGKRFAGFVNPLRTVTFFVKPEDENN